MTNMAYLTAAVMGLALAGVISVTYLMVHSATGAINLQGIMIVVAFLTPTITSLLGMLKTYENGTDIKELKKASNGQYNQLLEQTAVAAQMTEKVAAGVEAAKVLAQEISNKKE